MRFPWATLLLTVAILAPYFAQSQGTLYLPDEAIAGNAFAFEQAHALLTHMFYHVGVYHLIGNLLPLVLFVFLLEQILSPLDSLAIFFFSGAFASIIFSLANPSSFLVGASAGLSGVMAAATMLNPSRAVPLLLLAPLLAYLIFFPAVTHLNRLQADALQSQAAELVEQAEALEEQGLAGEAAEKRMELEAIQQKAGVVEQGQVREHSTQTDLFVHAYGALFAAAYLLLFKKDAVYRGLLEFDSLRSRIRSLFQKGQSY